MKWVPIKEEKTPAVKRAETNLPPYGELVKIIENQNALIELLQEENSQLKQCEADCREAMELATAQLLLEAKVPPSPTTQMRLFSKVDGREITPTTKRFSKVNGKEITE